MYKSKLKNNLLLLTVVTLLVFTSLPLTGSSFSQCIPGYNCPGDEPPPPPPTDYDADYELTILNHGIMNKPEDVQIRIKITTTNADYSPAPKLFAIDSSGNKKEIANIPYQTGTYYRNYSPSLMHDTGSQTLQIQFYNDGVKETVQKTLKIKRHGIIFIHGIYQDSSGWNPYLSESGIANDKLNSMYHPNDVYSVEYHRYDAEITKENIEEKCRAPLQEEDTKLYHPECHVPIGPGEAQFFVALDTISKYEDSLTRRTYVDLINEFLNDQSYILDIVAHSTGGLITRSLITDYFKSFHSYSSTNQAFTVNGFTHSINTVTTIGTPHDGIHIPLGVSSFVNDQFMMMDNSKTLVSWVRDTLPDFPSEIYTVGIAGMEYDETLTPKYLLPELEDEYHDGLVTLDSALDTNFDLKLRFASNHGSVINASAHNVLDNIKNRATETITAHIKISSRDFSQFECDPDINYIYHGILFNGQTVDYDHLRVQTSQNEPDGIDYYCGNEYTNEYNIDLTIPYSSSWPSLVFSLVFVYRDWNHDLLQALVSNSPWEDFGKNIYLNPDTHGSSAEAEHITLSSSGVYYGSAQRTAQSSFDLEIYFT